MYKDDSEKILMKLRYMYIYVIIKMMNLEIIKRWFIKNYENLK